MKRRLILLTGAVLALLSSSCRATYSSTEKVETKTDGSSTTETKTTMSGEIFPNGGTLKTDGTGVEVTVQGPTGTTTEKPEPGEEVPVPEGSTSVETQENAKPKGCGFYGPLLNPRLASGQPGSIGSIGYHRFERYVPEGEWEAFMYAEDASLLVSGKSAAIDLWREFVTNLTDGFTYAPSKPSALADVRFYGMRLTDEGGQLYVSFADTKPFSSLSLTLTEEGTANTATLDLNTPGTIQTSGSGWYVASIPVTFVPTNLVDPRIEVRPLIQNVGSLVTKGYARTIGW